MDKDKNPASVFDPDTFMHQEIESSNETIFTPIAEGDYTVMVDGLDAKSIVTKNGLATVLKVTLLLIDEEVLATIDMDKPTVPLDLFLDLDESGSLAMGNNKNVQLGRLREAVGQNIEGTPWAPSQLLGAGPLMAKVGHRWNKETGEGPYAEVKKVTAL